MKIKTQDSKTCGIQQKQSLKKNDKDLDLNAYFNKGKDCKSILHLK